MSDPSTQYFDLHTVGIGYLNRIREVKPRRGGDSFLAVDINALCGAADDVQHTRLDCKVVGTEAKRIVRAAIKHLEAERKVLVGFKIGDLYAEAFVYQHGERAGEMGIALKARLLRIAWVKIDGRTVYLSQATPASDAQLQGTEPGRAEPVPDTAAQDAA
jgi:hypothetical protein